MRIRLALKVLKDCWHPGHREFRYSFHQFIAAMKRLIYHREWDTRAKRYSRQAARWRIYAYRKPLDKKETE